MSVSRVAACVFSVLVAATAAAAPDSPLRLRDALDAALQHNPELRGFSYALKAQDGRAAQAALRANPELGFTAENFAGTGAVRGFTATEFTLTLSQVIDLGGQRARRIDVASAERGALEAEQAARQLDLAADVVRRFIDVVAEQERGALADEALKLARTTRDTVVARVKAARAPLAEGDRAQILVARAELEAALARRKLDTARGQLAALWGDAQPQFERVAADLYAVPAPRPFADLVARLDANPELARYVSEARLRDAELRLAIARRTPDLQLGAGVRRLQDGNDTALVFSATIPLPFRDRNQGAIAEAQAQRARVETDRDAARLRVQTELYGLYQELLQARDESAALTRDVLPLAEDALKQTEYAYQRGRYSYLEWVDAQRELLDVERRRIEAAAESQRLLAEIERLTAEPLALPAERGAPR